MQNVSVIIPTYKRPDSIITAVKSALNQINSVVEVIVVDDNDDLFIRNKTFELISLLKDPRLHVIPNIRAKGGCGARNTGILAAKNELIAFLDDDDSLYTNTALNSQVQFFKDHINSMVYGSALVVDEIYDVQHVHRPRKTFLSFQNLLEGECPSTTSIVMVRKSVLITVGLFDESLPSFQDYDLWMRISKGNYKIAANSEIVAQFTKHRGIRTSIDMDKRINGLNIICEKWGNEINAHYDIEKFRRKFLSSVFFSNGLLKLASTLTDRRKSLLYMFKAFHLTTNKKWRNLKFLILSLLGFNVTRLYMKFKYETINSR